MVLLNVSSLDGPTKTDHFMVMLISIVSLTCWKEGREQVRDVTQFQNNANWLFISLFNPVYKR